MQQDAAIQAFRADQVIFRRYDPVKSVLIDRFTVIVPGHNGVNVLSIPVQTQDDLPGDLHAVPFGSGQIQAVLIRRDIIYIQNTLPVIRGIGDLKYFIAGCIKTEQAAVSGIDHINPVPLLFRYISQGNFGTETDQILQVWYVPFQEEEKRHEKQEYDNIIVMYPLFSQYSPDLSIPVHCSPLLLFHGNPADSCRIPCTRAARNTWYGSRPRCAVPGT